jgi:H+/Cl- antiporter ClcA
MLSIYGSLVVLAFVNPIALDNIGWHYYIVFCCILVVIVLVAWFCFPETKGHSLEEISEIFDGPSPRPMVDSLVAGKGAPDEHMVEHVSKA